MGDELPLQMYKSFMLLEQDGIPHRHSPKGDRVNKYGIISSGIIDPSWSSTAYRIHSDIDKNPEDAGLIIEAIQLIRRVFLTNSFGIQTNHYNHATFVSMMSDLFQHHIEKKSRNLSQHHWERLLQEDDPEQRGELDKHGSVFRFNVDVLDKCTDCKDSVLDMLCVINTLTKLLQK